MKNKTLIHGTVFSLATLLSILSASSYEKAKSRSFSIFYTPQEHPYFETELNGNHERFIIDTGGSFHLKLEKSIASALPEFRLDRIISSININSKSQKHYQYVMDELNFMRICFSKMYFISYDRNEPKTNLIEIEKESQFSKIVSSKQDASCFIGHRLLDGLSITLDFSQGTLKLYKSGLIPLFNYPYGYFTGIEKIPIHYDTNQGISFLIHTNLGPKRFLIDTGSPVSLYWDQGACCNKTTQDTLASFTFDMFKIGSSNFENVSLSVIDNLPFESIDGILGMDFLYDKTLFINLKEDYLSIQ